MRVYISTRGDVRGIARAKEAATLLEADGHEITVRWWESIEANRALGISDQDLSVEKRTEYAQQDLNGILACDIFLYLEPHEKSEGAAWELGVAQGLTKMMHRIGWPPEPYIIAVGARRAFMFSELADKRVLEIREAVALLRRFKEEDQEP